MKLKAKNKIFLVVLGIIFALSTISRYNVFDDQWNDDGTKVIRDETNSNNPKKSGGYSESYIHIDGSIPGNWSDTLAEPWCNLVNGKYVIENVTIDATSSPTGSGIFINNSITDYFIIRNVTVYNAGGGMDDAGIKLKNTNNGSLTNNNCSNNINNRGIFLISSNNNNVSGNTCNNNIYGIFLESSDNNIISGNSVNNSINDGISLSVCAYNNVSGNNANYNKEMGIFLFNSGLNNISGNTCYNNKYGIHLIYSDSNTISGNTANDNNQYGINLWNSDSNTVSGNTANNNLEYGIILPSDSNDNNITENYIYLNAIGAIVIKSGIFGPCKDNIISGNIIISSGLFINDTGINTIIKYNYFDILPPSFIVEVIDLSFSTTEFIVSINISSQVPFLQVSNLSIQIWWNETLVHANDIDDIGYGLYKVSLTPIFVEPGEDPIILNVTISAIYHQDKYYKLNLAVDPEAVDKSPPPDGDGDDGGVPSDGNGGTTPSGPLLPGAFILNHNALNPDTDGVFTLNWTASSEADNYSIYVHNSLITEINTSVDAVAHGVTDLNHTISGLSNGTYDYIVVAFNEAGNTLSNCVDVTVAIPPGEEGDGNGVPLTEESPIILIIIIISSVSVGSAVGVLFILWRKGVINIPKINR